MVDVLTPEQRKLCMSRIRNRGTKPELVVRSIVHTLGGRYRLNVRGLPGTPDLVLPGRRSVIFVHGCFWHRHRCRFGQAMPATRYEFWSAKFQRNIDRDRRVRRELRKLGWQVLIVWECQTKDPERLMERIAKFLG